MLATGEITGRMVATHQAQSTSFQGSLNTTETEWLTYSQLNARTRNANGQWNQVWKEPRIDVLADGSFDAGSGTLHIQTASIDAPTAKVTASGTLSRMNDDMFADLQGTTEYDWDVLSKRLRRYLGTQVQIRGKQQKPFSLQGPLLAKTTTGLTQPVSSTRRTRSTPLVSNELQASAEIGWATARAYGLDFQKSAVQANLLKQEIRFSSFELPVAQGKISASPLIDLSGRSPLLLHDKGRVINNVKLSPELCKTWLKYVAPLLADATEAEGLFSVDLARASMPLDRPYTATVAGTLHVEQAYVGPGSMSKQFLQLANQIKAMVRGGNGSRVVNTERSKISMPPQNISFEMADGQIGHRGLVMQFGDVSVRTEGWVSLDERLQMTASIPIQEEWVGDERLLRGLAGQTLDIPIRGTLSQPRLDSRAVQQLTRKAVSGAAEGLIKDELGKQLEKLFK
jgi:hypothetical protein